MSTPLWFMDVDGVLNFFPDDGITAGLQGARTLKASPNRWPRMSQEDKEEARWRPGGLQRYKITYDPDITDRIKALHESGIVQVVWLTTWGFGANGELGAGLGWPRLESAGEPTWRMSGLAHTTDSGRWWKWNCIEPFLAARPDVEKFVWSDDHFAFEREAEDWARARGGLTICPDETFGLTAADLDTVEAYLKADVHQTADGIR